VAGKIIADKAGKPWGEAMQERILTPLGMTGTKTSVAEMLATSDYSAPHSKINDKIAVVKPMPVPNAVGAVGINTNAEDIARWMTVLLNEGKMDNGKQLFSAKQAARCGPSRRRCASANRNRRWRPPSRTSTPMAWASSCATTRAARSPCTAARCKASIRRC
jgi:CubicO group peptidase (beta-lactamase class C family)